MCSFSRDYPTPATDERQVANYDCSNPDPAGADIMRRATSRRRRSISRPTSSSSISVWSGGGRRNASQLNTSKADNVPPILRAEEFLPPDYSKGAKLALDRVAKRETASHRHVRNAVARAASRKRPPTEAPADQGHSVSSLIRYRYNTMADASLGGEWKWRVILEHKGTLEEVLAKQLLVNVPSFSREDEMPVVG